MGAPENRDAGAYAGKVYIFLGDGSWLDPVPGNLEPNWPGARYDSLGDGIAGGAAGLAGAPDRSLGHPGIPNDRAPDLVAAAPYVDSGPGYLAVLYGARNVVSVERRSSPARLTDNPATPEPQDGLGALLSDTEGVVTYAIVSYVGDLNHDGYQDLAVGDIYAESKRGQVVIFY